MDDPNAAMGYFKNVAQLLDHGDPSRRDLLDIANAGLAAADPRTGTLANVSLTGNKLSIGGSVYELTDQRKVFVIGTGKASVPIAQALEELLGDRIDRGLIIAKQGYVGSLKKCRLMYASHPFPDEHSLEAGKAAIKFMQEVTSNDIVLACITGGSSSLMVLPAPGISILDKALTHRTLLTCGANILQINAVRKHISQIKGGRLAQMLPPGATLINLTVSDVIGDPLDYITDNTVPDTSTIADAHDALTHFNLWDRLPQSVVQHLSKPAASIETMREEDLAHVRRQDIILVPGHAACQGAHEAAVARGYNAMILSSQFEGESRELGRAFSAIAKEILSTGQPIQRPCAIISGGETTVHIPDGQGGSGGPNQEFAVAAALEIHGLAGVSVLGIDTDGTDGPTKAAGGLVDGTTLERAESSGCPNPSAALKAHDVTPLLEAVGDIVVTGHTGTNVNDLKLMIVS
jgi:hydroxypyruvate reductase/glycerate 2-kinase